MTVAAGVPTGAAQPPATPLARLRRAGSAAAGQLRRHWAFAAVLAAGAVLRALVVIAYRPAFFYIGDSVNYFAGANDFIPHPARPFGYSFLIWLLHPLGQLWRFVALQHLAGLALCLLLYVFLQRRGVSRPAATIALAPIVLDPRTVVLEHYVLSETLFTCLMAGGILLLCRRTPPGWIVCAAAGALFTAAALTRSVGLAMLPLALLYLLLRRVGWRGLLAFGAVTALGLAGYATWYHEDRGSYTITAQSGRFLYSRVATFVDCDRLELTVDERRMCPIEPLGQRLPPDLYLWGPTAAHAFMPEPKYDAAFSSFARKAILAQPGDYARTVVVDTATFLRPDGGMVDRSGNSADRIRCLTDLWQIPEPGKTPMCHGHWYYGSMTKATRGSFIYEHQHPLSGPLSSYSRHFQVPTTAIGLAVLAALVFLLWPRRRSSWRQALDPLLWCGMGFGLVVASVATSALDPRYTVPSLPLVLTGAALAWANRRERGAPDQVIGVGGDDGGPNRNSILAPPRALAP
jgi:hypothetical protein